MKYSYVHYGHVIFLLKKNERKNQTKIPPIWTIFKDQHDIIRNGIGNRGIEVWDKATDSLEYFKKFNIFY